LLRLLHVHLVANARGGSKCRLRAFVLLLTSTAVSTTWARNLGISEFNNFQLFYNQTLHFIHLTIHHFLWYIVLFDTFSGNSTTLSLQLPRTRSHQCPFKI
jgi:hypothetical protein